MTPAGGMVGEVLKESRLPSCPKCERCGAGLVCDPSQIPICSTCAPAEVAELRAQVVELRQREAMDAAVVHLCIVAMLLKEARL